MWRWKNPPSTAPGRTLPALRQAKQLMHRHYRDSALPLRNRIHRLKKKDDGYIYIYYINI